MKVATAIALSVAFAAALAAAPQAPKPASAAKPAAKADQAKPAATKPAPKMTAEKVAAADIPAPVKDAVMKAHPKATISGATKSMTGSAAWYTVSYMDGAKKGTMKLDAMGKPAAAKK